jgi:hypothetical protein
VKGYKMALDSFYAGACEEGKAIAMEKGDPEKSWKTCERADWMLWLLRRQASITDVPDPARAIIRLFYEFVEEAYDELLEPPRAEMMERYANALRAIMPNPFTSEGYDWLHVPSVSGKLRRTAPSSSPSRFVPPTDGGLEKPPGLWKRLVRWIKTKP